VTRLTPNKALYWWALARAYNNAHRFSDQFATLQAAQRTAGSQFGYADWYNLGLQYQEIHACPQGIEAFQKSVHLNAAFGDGWNNLGACQQEMGQYSGAQAAFQQAARLGQPQAAANLARLNTLARTSSGAGRGPTASGERSPFDGRQQDLHEYNCRAYGHDDSSARSASSC
jgi:tetratricopeptide (TPR) repeat protein